MADAQDRAEGLDDDKIEDLDYPPDNPIGVDDPTQDDRVTDSISERAAREQPDAAPADDVTLVDPDAGGGPDVDKDLVGEAEPSSEERSEQLANERVPSPAEEAAVQIEPEAP